MDAARSSLRDYLKSEPLPRTYKRRFSCDRNRVFQGNGRCASAHGRKRQWIRDSDIELPAPTQIRLRSTRRFQPVELLAAATETVNRIVSALAWAREPVLEQALA